MPGESKSNVCFVGDMSMLGWLFWVHWDKYLGHLGSEMFGVYLLYCCNFVSHKDNKHCPRIIQVILNSLVYRQEGKVAPEAFWVPGQVVIGYLSRELTLL
ncbi:hypothetical protein B0T09DRAFT_161136 [Sordaria sp. MPI-SDFR-AT-0083]|nr:hypothetical protein B0T09DRAFT_161136 [Sordaria sp. MPI-SDFR-AT-0083]